MDMPHEEASHGWRVCLFHWSNDEITWHATWYVSRCWRHSPTEIRMFGRQWRVNGVSAMRICSFDLVMYWSLIKEWPNPVSCRSPPWARVRALLLVVRPSAHYTSYSRDKRLGNWLWNVESMRGRSARPRVAIVRAAVEKVVLSVERLTPAPPVLLNSNFRIFPWCDFM